MHVPIITLVVATVGMAAGSALDPWGVGMSGPLFATVGAISAVGLVGLGQERLVEVASREAQ